MAFGAGAGRGSSRVCHYSQFHGDRPFVPVQHLDQQYKLAEVVMSCVNWTFTTTYLSQSCLGQMRSSVGVANADSSSMQYFHECRWIFVFNGPVTMNSAPRCA